MNNEIKNFILEILTAIRPEYEINEYIPFAELKLDEIDYTLIAIECEEKFQIHLDEKVFFDFIYIKDAIHYISDLLELKKTSHYNKI